MTPTLIPSLAVLAAGMVYLLREKRSEGGELAAAH
jgi:hypothetical protein